MDKFVNNHTVHILQYFCETPVTVLVFNLHCLISLVYIVSRYCLSHSVWV